METQQCTKWEYHQQRSDRKQQNTTLKLCEEVIPVLVQEVRVSEDFATEHVQC